VTKINELIKLPTIKMPIIILGKIEKKNIIDATQE